MDCIKILTGAGVVPLGAALNSGRSGSGVANSLHQQHLTAAQQATQAAITAPATHQDGKVPVRTGLAWAALGAFLLACLPVSHHLPCYLPQPPLAHDLLRFVLQTAHSRCGGCV